MKEERLEKPKENTANVIIDAGDGTELETANESIALMEKPFDPTLIKVETKNQSLDSLIKRIDRGSIQMNTESYFQRKDDLWDKTKQSRLIESILIRFPLPAFFFDASDDNNWLIVDGLQRLSSIRNFAVLKKQPLCNMEFLTHLNGTKWDDLAIDLQRTIEETKVVLHKIMPGTPTDVKYNIFKRINTGGLILEPQEIRHALFQGRPARFIHELAETQAFKEVTENRISTKRMLDRDFANRFLAFFLLGTDNYGQKDYGQDIDSYMSRAMAEIYNISEEELSKIKQAYESSMLLAKKIFDKEAFRKVRGVYKKLPPINKALFDGLSTQFALLNEDQIVKLEKNKSKFKTKFREELENNYDFFKSVTSATGDEKRVKYRHQIIKELIYESIKEV